MGPAVSLGLLDIIVQQTTNSGPKKPKTELPVCLAQAWPT